jgi:hypothetical protein
VQKQRTVYVMGEDRNQHHKPGGRVRWYVSMVAYLPGGSGMVFCATQTYASSYLEVGRQQVGQSLKHLDCFGVHIFRNMSCSFNEIQ